MLQTTFALLVFLFPLAFSPGPGNIFFAANGARFGFRATLPANVGYHLATWVVTLALGFGFLEIVEKVPQVFVVLKFLGALYVLWLAWKLFRSGVLDRQHVAKPARFHDGVALLLLNPKAYVIIALMFTQFLQSGSENAMASVVLITTVFTLNNLAAFCLWALVGDRIARAFTAETSAHRLNTALAVVLASVAFWMLLS